MGFYDDRAKDARKQAKLNVGWGWFNIVFFCVNVFFVLRWTPIWWLNAIAAIVLAACAVMMFSIAKRNRELAVNWDELSKRHATTWG